MVKQARTINWQAGVSAKAIIYKPADITGQIYGSINLPIRTQIYECINLPTYQSTDGPMYLSIYKFSYLPANLSSY